jgi:tetratricopeptide (TPR) repeat protein
VTYEKNNEPAEAEKVYNRALELNPTYFDAHYNLAVMYYNQGIDKSKMEIPLKEVAKYDAWKVEKKLLFQKAADHFRVCYDQNRQDTKVKKVLAECYGKSDQQSKIPELD